MALNTLLAFGAALLSGCLGVFILLRGSRSLAYRLLSAGMILLALEQVAIGLGFMAASPREVLSRQWAKALVGSAVPGVWLAFGLSFARMNYRQFLATWKWVLLAFLAFPVLLVSSFSDFLFTNATALESRFDWLVGIGATGYLYYTFSIVSSVVILMVLEKTLRSFTGTMRWQIKFLIVGIFGIFSIRIFISSQVLLYSSFSTPLDSLGSGALIVADALIVWALLRVRLQDVDIYLSPTVVYGSLTVLLTGIYLLAIGALAAGVGSLGRDLPLPVEVIFILLAVTGLAVLFLSDSARQRFRGVVNRHLKRPHYDYRQEWSAFAQRTAAVLDLNELCAAVAKRISETFGTPSVSVWLFDSAQPRLRLEGSTALSMSGEQTCVVDPEALTALKDAMRRRPLPEDLRQAGGELASTFRDRMPQLGDSHVRYCAPLVSAGEPLGFITLSERLSRTPFSFEDFDLLKIMADQTAGNLLNLRLSEQLRVARQMEAFQAISAFFVHDLKNLASTLSLTLQNLPIYFDNAEFREDALRVIGRSVEKINSMCGQLSALRGEIRLDRRETELHELVAETLSGLNGCLPDCLSSALAPVPPLSLDPDQIRKVVTNLVLNARDAIRADGKIHVETGTEGHCAVFSVTDDGCGIPREFLERSLFSPFKTTKKKGIGIGLFQCKTIIEAHGGRIEAQSEEGKGSAFRVILPLAVDRESSNDA